MRRAGLSAIAEFLVYPRDVVRAVYATATWLAGWLAGWVSVHHTPVLYQNGKTYLKPFSTIW